MREGIPHHLRVVALGFCAQCTLAWRGHRASSQNTGVMDAGVRDERPHKRKKGERFCKPRMREKRVKLSPFTSPHLKHNQNHDKITIWGQFYFIFFPEPHHFNHLPSLGGVRHLSCIAAFLYLLVFLSLFVHKAGFCCDLLQHALRCPQ